MPEPDYDKLAAQHGGKPVDYDAIAASVTAEPVAASSASGGASFTELAGEYLGAVKEGVVAPITILKQLYDDVSGEYAKSQEAARQGDIKGAIGHGLAASPAGAMVKLGAAFGAGHVEQFRKAKKAYDEGRYSEALGYTAAGATPLVGPMAATMGEEIGTGDPRQIARALGTATTLGLPAIAGKVLPSSVRVPGTGAFRNPNAVERAAVAYGERAGIPIDAATASGSPMVQAAQGLADYSAGGAIPGARFRAGQRAALTREAAALEQRAASGLTSPEAAGRGLKADLGAEIAAQHRAANQQYGRLREIGEQQAMPVQTGTQRITRTFEDLPGNDDIEFLKAVARNGGMTVEAGTDLAGEFAQLLENRSRGASTIERAGNTAAINQAPGKGGTAVGGVSGVVRRTGGKNPDTLAEALREDGYRDIAGPRELFDRIEAARERLMRPETGRGKADVFDEPIIETMSMPMDLTEFRQSVRPMFEQFERDAARGPLYGDSLKTYRALGRLMDGPAIRSAAEIDRELGQLKGLARFEGPVQLRGAGKGGAAYAVGKLEEQVKQTVADFGPEATAAREAGKAATKRKYEVGELRRQLKDEPVRAYKQATEGGDLNLDYLKQLRSVAPQRMPEIGRAWLSQEFGAATGEGGFKGMAGAKARWDKLGPETKKIVFPDAALRSDLDNFFLLSKRIEELPNPSKSALVGSVAGQAAAIGALNPVLLLKTVLGGYGLAKLLRSRTGVKALTEAMRFSLAGPKAKTQAALAASRVASMAGVRPSMVPALAGSEERSPAETATK